MDAGYQPYYDLALEHNLPVVFHTGDTAGNRYDPTDAHPLLVDAVARKHPDLRIVLAHMGWPWMKDAAFVAYRHPNVWIDLSGHYTSTSKALDEMLQSGELRTIADTPVISDLVENLIMINKYDRLLYASDFPVCNLMPSYRRFIEAVIPKEHHEKVFRKNAEELFGIKLEVAEH